MEQLQALAMCVVTDRERMLEVFWSPLAKSFGGKKKDNTVEAKDGENALSALERALNRQGFFA